MRLTPTPRLLAAAWAQVALALAAAFLAPLMTALYGAATLLALLAATDALIAWRRRPPQVTRQVAHAFPLGHWCDVVLDIEHVSGRALDVEVFDLHPDCADSEGWPARLRLTAGQVARVQGRLRFNRRGQFRLPGTHLRLFGPLGLVHCLRTLGEDTPVRVYPDFAAVARYALLATDNRLSQLGIRRRQRRGEGLEFHQLREYRAGDALRQVDWKATSRLRKLVSREYQDERDQQVVFLLDCGFRMNAQDGARSHFDAALNALLLLSYVVLRQGDAVGCQTFADDSAEGRWLAPAKGRDRMALLMNSLYDLQPTHRTPDFRQLATTCAGRVHKRSLLVLMSNLRDEDTADLVAAARFLGEQHLVLVATLREPVLDRLREGLPADAEPGDAIMPPGDHDVITSAATRMFLSDRERALRALRTAGLFVLDCTPEQLPVRLVNAYLEIKRSGRL